LRRISVGRRGKSVKVDKAGEKDVAHQAECRSRGTLELGGIDLGAHCPVESDDFQRSRSRGRMEEQEGKPEIG
jgi:hypothetical protein